MQAAFSAYVASRDTRYLIQLREAGDAFDRNLEDVAVSVTDNSQQEQRWKRFTKTYVPGKFEELGKNDSREPPSVIFAKADAYGQHVLEALDAFTAAEYALRTQRIANQGRVNQAIIVLVPLLSTLIAEGCLMEAGAKSAGPAGSLRRPSLGRKKPAVRRTILLQPFRTN
jgi:hypothetical protein